MTVFHVTNQAQLLSALAKASGGDTISLAGGNYGDVSLIHDKNGADLEFSSNVTVTSADIKNPAVFTGLALDGAKNLTFDRLVFDYVFKAGDPLHTSPFRISSSDGVTIRNSIFDGDLAKGVSNTADGYGYGKGLSVSGSSNITIRDNEFFNFHRGATFSTTSHLVVSGNDVHSIRSDGFNFSSVSQVLIQANHLHDFKASIGSSDHRDMIQFWTTGTTDPSSDIIIRGNFLDVGDGGWTQSIFMRNELVDQGQAGQEMFYRNILIENNVIQNNHLHGITVGETVGLIIRSNTIVRKESLTGPVLEGGVGTPSITVSSDAEKVTIQQNIVSKISGHEGQGDWILGKNVLVQHTSPNAPEFYGDIFISSTLAEGAMGPVLLTSSTAYAMKAGAAQTLGQDTPGLSGRIHVTGFDDDGALRIFDARFSAADGKALPAGTIYLWSFDDGSQYMGPVVGYRFDEGGTFGVRLTVMMPDGRTDTADYTIDVSGPEVLKFEAGQSFAAFDYGDAITLDGSAALTAKGLALGGETTVYSVDAEHLEKIPGSDELRIDFSIKAANTTSIGEIFRLHESFAVGLNSNGELYADIYAANGQKLRIESAGIHLNDLAEHDVSIGIADNSVTMLIDGKTVAEAAMTDVLAGSGSRSLIFGNPWGKANFDGWLTRLSIEKDSADFSATGESQGYAVVTETSSDWSMLCTPTQTDEAGTMAFSTFLGEWVAASSSDDLIPMI